MVFGILLILVSLFFLGDVTSYLRTGSPSREIYYRNAGIISLLWYVLIGVGIYLLF